MAEITLEQIHALLEKLAAYVMNETATKAELNQLREYVTTELISKKVFERQFNDLEQRQTLFEKGLAGLEKRQASFESRQEALETRMSAFETRMSAFETRMSAFETRMSAFETRMVALEDRHSLLEQSIRILINVVNKKADKTEVEKLGSDVEIVKRDLHELKDNFQTLLTGMDKIVGELTVIRTEQKAFVAALSRIEKRVGDLEARVYGYRVRDEERSV